jgi:hypothetical protein
MANGLSAVTVVNLFSWRATKPADLRLAARANDIVGARTDNVIAEISGRSSVTLAAWGAHGALFARSRAVTQLLHEPVCLEVTACGEPRHPLYVSGDAPAVPYERP